MSIRINKRIIFYILLLIPFFKPVGPSIYGLYNTLFLGAKLLSIVILLILLMRENNFRLSCFENDKWIIGLFLFFLIYLINCVRNSSTDLIGAISSVVVILELIAITVCHVNEIRKTVYVALDFIFSTWLLFHILSVFYIRTGHIIFQDLGTDYTYFLGTDNYSAFATIPMMSVVLFLNCNKNDIGSKLKRIVLSFGLCISYIYTNAVAASIASLLLIFLYYLAGYWKSIIKIITIKRVVMFSGILLILIIAFNIQNYILGFLSFIGKGEKGTTLNSRTVIWGMAVNLIKENPIFGIGELSDEAVNNFALYGVGHAHNLFLDLLLKTGVIGAASYLYFYIGILSKYVKKLNNSQGVILIISLIVFFILSMLDDYPFVPYIYCCIGVLWGYAKYDRDRV